MVLRLLKITSRHITSLPHITTSRLHTHIGATISTISVNMDVQSVHNPSLANMPYTHCKTRIISLLDFDMPDKASEAEYKELYKTIAESKSPTAQSLVDAVSSVSLGIAPPVAFPTETVYGLGADATNRASIAGIFAAKGRPSDNPLIVHVASKEDLERLTGENIPEVYQDLIKDHWPGPLTILIPLPSEKTSVFAPNVHPGQRTIGFRVPESKFARFFIAATGKPIAAPSANSSGKPSPTTARHVLDDLNGKINFILDGGSCDVGVESTVVDGLHDPPLILRPGGLSQDDLVAHGRKYGNVWEDVQVGYKQKRSDGAKSSNKDENGSIVEAMTNGSVLEQRQDLGDGDAPRAPGMKYKHYAPKGRMILFEGKTSEKRMQEELNTLSVQHATTVLAMSHSHMLNGTNTSIQQKLELDSETVNIAILTTTSWSSSDSSVFTLPQDTNITVKLHVTHLGTTPGEIARSLFAALRTCDDLGCLYIFAEAPISASPRDILAAEKESAIDNSTEGRETDLLRFQFEAVLERMRKAASQVVSS